MGHGFWVWETFPLLVTFLSFWLRSQPHVDALFSHITHLSPSKGFPPCHRNVQCLCLSQVLFRTFSVIFPSLSPIQSFFLDSLSSTGYRAVCLCVCVGLVQTSCGPGWISSPARLLLEIHPGFSSQSKSGRPRLSQHNTGPSVSTYSSSSSAVQRERGSPREGRDTDLVYASCLQKTRKNSDGFWRGPLCYSTICWCCRVCAHKTSELKLTRVKELSFMHATPILNYVLY